MNNIDRFCTITAQPLSAQEVNNLVTAARMIAAGGLKAEKAERLVRAWLKTRLYPHAESVAWIRRSVATEFVALVVPNGSDWAHYYEQILELVTTPGCPLVISREHEGKYDRRVYLAVAYGN